MGLCMVVLEQEEPDTGFQLSQHVVMWIYEPKGAALGEVFITALMRAYTVHAGGFTHAAAGISGNSIKNVSDDQWRLFQNFIATDYSYMRRM